MWPWRVPITILATLLWSSVTQEVNAARLSADDRQGVSFKNHFKLSSYRIFGSFEHSAAQELHLAWAGQTAYSRNLALPSLENAVYNTKLLRESRLH